MSSSSAALSCASLPGAAFMYAITVSRSRRRSVGVVTAPPWSLWRWSRRGRYATVQHLHQWRSKARLPRMVLEAEPEASRQVAERMADAARAWLDSLTVEQRQVASGTTPTDDATDAERRRWFYTPTDHGGLTLHQQRPAQQQAAMRLVASGLSTAGYVTVATTMGLENVLDQTEGFVTRFDRERGRDPGLYYLRVFGDPGGARPWGWRFGGHHVSLNNLVVDRAVASTTPCFMGADPASSPLLGGAVNRPLGPVEDLARDLVRSLAPELAARAVLLPKAPSDLVTGNRTVVAEGDRVIPLAGIWREERFADAGEQARLQASSDAIDEAAGYDDVDHAAVEYTAEPRG